jgi:hypothetical protein
MAAESEEREQRENGERERGEERRGEGEQGVEADRSFENEPAKG